MGTRTLAGHGLAAVAAGRCRLLRRVGPDAPGALRSAQTVAAPLPRGPRAARRQLPRSACHSGPQ